MAIINRSLGSSQKREVYVETIATATGQTYPVAIVPFPGALAVAEITGMGLSGAPNVSLWLNRFVAGAGVTSIVIGQSMVLTTFGTSGPVGFTLLAGTNATFPLIAGDVISLSTAAANTGTVATTIVLAVECTQDIKSHFGV